ncbi:MAG: hypothetical protein ACI39U_06495 [Candidatus Cryptobacteroides sp.]
MPGGLDRPDVIYSSFIGKGVALNRNHCLDMARQAPREEDEICLLADDDIRYMSDSFDTVMDTFRENPDISVAAFRIRTPQGQPDYKKYPDRTKDIRKIPLSGKFYFSTIEIAFRLSSVGDLRFDEDFGIGAAKWPEGGEEPVFLSDCLKRGLKMRFFPKEIVEHGYISTGKAHKSVRKAQMMRAVACRCRGPFSFEAILGSLRVLYRRLLRMV